MKKKSIVRPFYKGKHCKKVNSDNIIAMLLPSVLGIILCAICLVGSTWAWFTATQSTATQTIQAANYEVAAVIKSGETEVAAEKGKYTLTAGTYTVTLSASGDATTGYCVLDFAGAKAYTKQITKGDSITLALTVNEPATLKITAVWGTYAGDDQVTEYTYGTAPAPQENPPAEEKDDTTEPSADTTENSTTEETTTTETEPTLDPTQYVVQSGDTLDKIAKLYNTTAAILQAYNNIENANHIEVGDTIKIPPADWKIPETTTEETTLPTTTKSEPPSTEPVSTEPSETGSETTDGVAETTVTQETTGTTQIPSESDSNE